MKMVELILQANITETTQLYKSGEIEGLFTVLINAGIMHENGAPIKVVHFVDYMENSVLIIGRPEYKDLNDVFAAIIARHGLTLVEEASP